MALVAKEEIGARPGEIGIARGEQGIEAFGSRAAGERDREAALRADRLAADFDKFFARQRGRDRRRWGGSRWCESGA